MATDTVQGPTAHAKLQAGGGEALAVKRLDHVSPTVLSHLKAYAEGKRPLDNEQLREVHGLDLHPAEAGGKTLELKAFLGYMTSEKANAMLPAPTLELDHPISSYYISSSHNSYLQGNQLWGEASSEVYDNVMIDDLSQLAALTLIRSCVVDVGALRSTSGTDKTETTARKRAERPSVVSRVTCPKSLTSFARIRRTGDAGKGARRRPIRCAPTRRLRSCDHRLHGAVPPP